MAQPAGLRRGLPRTRGGEPWPPALTVAAGAVRVGGAVAPDGAPSTVGFPTSITPPRGVALRRGLPRVAGGDPWPPAVVGEQAVQATVPSAPAVPPDPAGTALRRGLPRRAGGEPWPPAAAVASAPTPAPPSTLAPAPEPVPAAAAAAAVEQAPVAAPDRPPGGRRFTRRQVVGAAVLGTAWVLVLAAGAVLMTRALLGQPFLQDFLASYPGEYELPAGAPVGIPAWLGWQHFLNAFLMAFIVKTGLQVRREQRPSAYWAPRRNPGSRISLTVWFHQAMDILWLANGVAFMVLIFTTGQWLRIVPTSWEVLPNALSAGLQYISLDWPTENGWVNYNALQQLAYFSVTFIAAPLSALSGWRMSGLWPRRNATLSRLVPLEWARRLHFPLMLYFVCFITVHVFLVLATGALRNLNHMYAAQGSVDPTAFAANWTGFFWFAASLLVMVGAVVAARPMLIAPLARLFGTVSGR